MREDIEKVIRKQKRQIIINECFLFGILGCFLLAAISVIDALF